MEYITYICITTSLTFAWLYLRCRQRLARCRIVAARFSTENKELMREHTRLYQDCVALRRELSALREAPLKRWEAAAHFPDESQTLKAFKTIANQPLRTFGGREHQED